MARKVLSVVFAFAALALVNVPATPTSDCVDVGGYLIEATTFDGQYTVRVNYSVMPDNPVEAGYLCVAALQSYASHVAWGFEAQDQDGILEVSLGEYGTSIEHSPDFEAVVGVERAVTAYATFNLTDNETILRTHLQHEADHYFVVNRAGCYSYAWWSDWSFLWNSFASFSEILLYPESHHHQDRPFYEAWGGADDYVRAPNKALDEYNHDLALLLGYLYANDGGLALFDDIFEVGQGTCPVGQVMKLAVGYFDVALAANPGAHDEFASAFEDFAVDVIRGENLSWGPPGGLEYDWAEWLEPVARTQWPSNELRGTVQPWAFEAVDAPRSGGYTVAVNAQAPLEGVLMVHDGDNWTRTPLSGNVTIPAGLNDDVVVLLINKGLEAVDYTLQRSS